MSVFSKTPIACLTLILILAGLGVSSAADTKAKDADPPKEHWAGGMLPEDSPVTTRSYWRHWLTYAPPRVLKDGKLVPVSFRHGSNWAGGSWNQGVTQRPPEGWFEAGYDDSGWPVSRIPPNTVNSASIWGVAGLLFPTLPMVRQTCLRTRFIVPDPRSVKKLTFTAEYYGGLIVWVNGREVARQHIPADGILAKEGYAEPFPEEAYGPLTEEGKKRARQLKIGQRRRGGKVKWLWTYMKSRNAEHMEIARKIRRFLDRRIEIDLPRDVLQKGINVLALELRPSPPRDRVKGGWAHGLIRFVTLDPKPADAVLSADARPQGIQVWAEDIHRRMYTEDFLEPGVKVRKVVRLVGARGGRYSGQVMLGTTGKLTSPSAMLEALSGPGGAEIPGSVVSLRWGQPMDLIETRSRRLKVSKSTGGREHSISIKRLMRLRQPVWAYREQRERECYPMPAVGEIHGRPALGRKQKRNMVKEYGKGIMLFDPLVDGAPEEVPPGACRPLWITVQVPPSARPGLYTGTLTVSGGGMKAAALQVRLQVFDWRLPPPMQYTTYANIEQCPWSLAKCAGVELWSEEHWKLTEESIRWCGRLGARTAGLAVVQGSGLANAKDTMVKWAPKGEAGKAGKPMPSDFSIADRYLDLWKKYCHRKSDVIVYILSVDRYSRARAGMSPGTVVVVDPETGEESTLRPIGKEATAEGMKTWIDWCKAIRGHLNERGFADEHILWGMFHDKVGELNGDLIEALARELPGVGWARSSHYGSKTGSFAGSRTDALSQVKWDSAVRAANSYIGVQAPPFALKKKSVKVDGKRSYVYGEYKVLQHKGWKNPHAPINNAFADADVMNIGYPAKWGLRKWPEMTITTAYRGIARVLLDGFERPPDELGNPVSWLSYPTSRGVDGSVAFEFLCEGLQEAEARIFLEGHEQLDAEIRSLLDRRSEAAWHMPRRGSVAREPGWQEASWDLYAAAARVAGGAVPTAEEKKRFFGK